MRQYGPSSKYINNELTTTFNPSCYLANHKCSSSYWRGDYNLNLQVATGCLRTCTKCGKVQLATFEDMYSTLPWMAWLCCSLHAVVRALSDLPLKWPGGLFWKDPVPYQAGKSILETMIPLLWKAALLIFFWYNEKQNNWQVSNFEMLSYWRYKGIFEKWAPGFHSTLVTILCVFWVYWFSSWRGCFF